MKKTIFITNIFPLYRKALWVKLLNESSFNIDIYYSDFNPIGIKQVNKDVLEPKLQNCLKIIKNVWLFKKAVIWQIGVVRLALFSSYDNLMLLGEFQILSSWIAIFIARARGKRVFLWSHGLYGKESYIRKIIRVFFHKIAHACLVYENRGKQLLINQGISSDRIRVIYNSLDFESQNVIYKKLEDKVFSNPILFFKNNMLPTIIFVGRITAQKKIHQLINAVKDININLIKCNLLIVGEGSHLESLKNLHLINNGWLHFYGATYDEIELANLIYHSDLCVSPGNIGLTAIHSLTYGTPVASHSNFINQMPEVEIIEEGVNGFFFQENSIENISKKILEFLNNSKINKSIIRDRIVKHYNVNYQISIFKSLLS